MATTPREDVQIAVLGPVRATRAGEPIPLGGPKPQLLLARLALDASQAVSSDELIDVIWGEQPPGTARKILHKYVWALRRAIGDEVLVTEGDGYALAIHPSHVDALRLEQLVGEAADRRDHRSNERSWVLLAEAESLWRGRPLAGLDDVSWVADQVHRLEEMHLTSLEELVDVGLDLGKHDLLLPRIQELASRHPLRERLVKALMLALYRSGRHAEALAAFSGLRRTLGEELGLEPSPDLAELEQRILQHDPALRLQPPRAAGNLPARLTSFVGRASELADVAGLLAEALLVSLVGPAGSGKTRLALEAAERAAAQFTDGVWLVDLAAALSEAEVAEAFASSFGLKAGPGRTARQVLLDYLAGRSLLIVADNCERVVTGVASLLAGVLAAHDRVRVLATSREPIGVAGEHTYEVAPLSCPAAGERADLMSFDAVRLFVDRAQAADPEFRLGVEDAEAVVHICRRLDGLPLALELAAGRARSLPPTQLSQHLDERFELLVLPARSHDRRHRTLRAAIDWSYDALDARSQALLRRLSAFRGGFELEAAQAVCAFPPLEPDQILAILSDLVHKSLVAIDHRPGTGVRYRLLETLREYGAERLGDDEHASVADAHAAHFCAVAERAAAQLHGPRQEPWLRRLEANADNLREALRWTSERSPETAIRLAVALADYWDSVGSREEGQHWMGLAVELSDDAGPELAIAARIAASDLFVSTNLSHSIRYAEEAVAQARRLGDEIAEARALRALALAHALHEDHGATRRFGEEALAIFERLGDTWETALCLERLGQPTYDDPRISLDYLERSIALYRRTGDRRRQAVASYKLAARSAQALRNLDSARRWVEESLEIFADVGSPQDAAHAWLEYGKILRRQGEVVEATGVLEDAVHRLREVGDQRCTVRALTALGIARLDGGDAAGARQSLRQGLELGQALYEPQTSRVALAGMARVFDASGRLADAVGLYGYVEKLGRDYRIPVSAASQGKRRSATERLRISLGDETYQRAWQEGQAMDFAEAVTLALGPG